jgi:DNA-binding FadR family transcriptional regulator
MKKTKRRTPVKQSRTARTSLVDAPKRSDSRVSLAPRPRRLHGKIADQLGIAILAGEHPPGSFLPAEIQASQQHGVSRAAYREAIRILAAKGMVDSRPKAGTRVTPRANWQLLDPEVLRWVFSSKPTEEFVQGLFELREMIEPQAAALAARRRTSEQLALMGHALQEMARYGLSTVEGRAADQVFHAEILKATANEPLITLSATISAAIEWTNIFKQRRKRLERDPLPEHKRLYAAIADGDGDRAITASRELIRLALLDTKKSM